MVLAVCPIFPTGENIDPLIHREAEDLEEQQTAEGAGVQRGKGRGTGRVRGH